MSAVTTHVLDTALGNPAVGVPVRLDRVETGSTAAAASEGAVTPVATGTTDTDGRVADLGPDRLERGTYRLTFDTAHYFAATGQAGFYPNVTVTFCLTDPTQHHHVPVLLSPFAYSTYKGS